MARMQPVRVPRTLPVVLSPDLPRPRANVATHGLPEKVMSAIEQCRSAVLGGHVLRCSSFGPIRQHFALKRHLLRASLFRKHLAARFTAWREFTEVGQAPPTAF